MQLFATYEVYKSAVTTRPKSRSRKTVPGIRFGTGYQILEPVPTLNH